MDKDQNHTGFPSKVLKKKKTRFGDWMADSKKNKIVRKRQSYQQE